MNIFNAKLQKVVDPTSLCPYHIGSSSVDARVFWEGRPAASATAKATLSLCITLPYLRKGGVITTTSLSFGPDDTVFFTVKITHGKEYNVIGATNSAGTVISSDSADLPQTVEFIADLVSIEAYAHRCISESGHPLNLYDEMYADRSLKSFTYCDAIYFAIKDKTEIAKRGFAVVEDGDMSIVAAKAAFSKAWVDDEANAESEEEEEVKVDGVWKAITEGDYRLDYDFSEMSKHIPALSFLSTYIPTPEFFSFVKTFKYRLEKGLEQANEDTGISTVSAIHMLLTGEPGAGKTSMAFALAATFGLPIVVMPQSKGMDESLYMGDYSVKEGQVEFQESSLIKAAKYGGMVIFEEANMVPPGVTTYLNDFLDYPYQLRDRKDTVICRHPLCILGATMNPETEGSNRMNAAFVSRFKECAVIATPTREDVINILRGSHPDLTKSIVSWVVDLRQKIVDFLKSDAVCEPRVADGVSLRQVDAVLRAIEEGNSPLSAKERMVTTVFIASPELAMDVRKAADSFKAPPTDIFLLKKAKINKKKVSTPPPSVTGEDDFLDILTLE